MYKIAFALAAFSSMLAVSPVPRVLAVEPPTIQIDGQDGSWHELSPALIPGHWYAITVRSSVLVSSSEMTPSQLHLDVDHGPYGRHSFRGDGQSTIQQEIWVDATTVAPLRIRLHDSIYGDNSGAVVIGLRELSH